MEQAERIREEIDHCLKYEPQERRMCFGAGGRRLRRVCIYCPNYTEQEQRKDNEHEKDY